jgi:hypothetical protein
MTPVRRRVLEITTNTYFAGTLVCGVAQRERERSPCLMILVDTQGIPNRKGFRCLFFPMMVPPMVQDRWQRSVPASTDA